MCENLVFVFFFLPFMRMVVGMWLGGWSFDPINSCASQNFLAVAFIYAECVGGKCPRWPIDGKTILSFSGVLPFAWNKLSCVCIVKKNYNAMPV